jgi:hypothetical protein
MRIQYLASCVAGFLLAALAPAFVVAGLGQSIQLAPIAFFVSLGHAIFLGLPLFLIFRSKRWMNAISSIAGGFVVGVIPGGLLAWPLRPGSRSSASINGVPTVVDGIPTAAGWIHYSEALVYLGCFGALAGFVFWLVLKLSGGLAITAEVPGSRLSADGPLGLQDWARCCGGITRGCSSRIAEHHERSNLP